MFSTFFFLLSERKIAVNTEIKCTCCSIWMEEKMNHTIEFVFVFSQLNIARRAALVGWMKAKTFFFISFFIISLLFLWPNYLAGGLQRGPCATSGCKPRGMCLNGLIKVHHIARLLPSCCSLPGVVWFQTKVGLMKPWCHSQGFRYKHCKAWILCVFVPQILQLWWMLLNSRWAVQE